MSIEYNPKTYTYNGMTLKLAEGQKVPDLLISAEDFYSVKTALKDARRECRVLLEIMNGSTALEFMEVYRRVDAREVEEKHEALQTIIKANDELHAKLARANVEKGEWIDRYIKLRDKLISMTKEIEDGTL